MSNNDKVTLRGVTEGDRFRLRRWLAEPHVVQWWGSRAAAEAAMTMVQQSPTAVARMIDLDGEAIGYAHAMDVADTGLPPGAWLADVFVGAETQRGKGRGARALELLRAEVFASTLATELAVRVGVGNEQAVRAIERVGFSWRALVADPSLGTCWVLAAPRG